MPFIPRVQVPKTIWSVAKIIGVCGLIVLTYWAFIGISLDQSIRQHTKECEDRLIDPNTQQCVVAFIPIPK